MHALLCAKDECHDVRVGHQSHNSMSTYHWCNLAMQCQSICVMQELHAVAVACCSAAQVLHDDKLVHRDLRLPNVVQLGHQQYMVIDLESVASFAAEPLPEDFHHVLKTCTAEALDSADCVTAPSDMFCIGVLSKEVVNSR